MSANSDGRNRRQSSNASRTQSNRKFAKNGALKKTGKQKQGRSGSNRTDADGKPVKPANPRSAPNYRSSEKPRTGSKRPKLDSTDASRKRTKSTAPSKSKDRSSRTFSEEGTGKPRNNERRGTGKFDLPRRFQGDQPRRERDQRARGNAPVIDQDVTGDELGEELTSELNSLPTGLTITVAQHLVMTQRYLEINPELALVHATHAKELAGRFSIVREICGIAYYINGRWQEALNEFRAVKRMGLADHLIPMMADCERGLGRPERAIELLEQNNHLRGTAQIEAAIVKSGARADLNQLEAALVALKIPALASFPSDLTSYARLCFAYAKALSALGRDDEAQEWFSKADKADSAATLAAEYLPDAQNTVFLDDLDAS